MFVLFVPLIIMFNSKLLVHLNRIKLAYHTLIKEDIHIVVLILIQGEEEEEEKDDDICTKK